MPDDPKQYESEVTRVPRVSGSRWALAWMGGSVLVVAVGLAGGILAPPPTTPTLADVASQATRPAEASALPPLVIESTDFHGNGGAAYYGIGGKLIRALGPTPTPTTP